jgi:hypothetical protein
MVAPSTWLKARMQTRSPMLTPGPNTTLGSITLSRPISVSWANHTVSGATRVTPSAIAFKRRRRCHSASTRASSARLLTSTTAE